MRSPLLAASSLAALLVTPALGQTANPAGTVQRHHAPSTSKYAGIYHVPTATWIRSRTAAAGLAPDVIYSNTSNTGYFTSAGSAGGFAAGSENVDEGGLPGIANGDPFVVGPNRNEYRVNAFSLNYCDFNPPQTGGWTIRFYESYTPCGAPGTPDAEVVLAGLPSNGCWIVDIDLGGGAEFTLGADGGNGWQNDTDTDSFGWGFEYAGTDGSAEAGFFLAGDPANSDPGWVPSDLPRYGAGTYYGGPEVCGTTGYVTQDLFWIEDPTSVSTACYFFGGYTNMGGCGQNGSIPYASFCFELYAEATGSPISVVYCTSNPNSTGATSSLVATGSPFVQDDDVRLTAGNLPVDSVGYFVTSATQGFVANPGGSEGNLCLDGAIGRFAQPSQIRVAGANGQVSLDTNAGDWSVLAIPTPLPPLTYSAMAGTSTSFQYWHRDVVNGARATNFSDGIEIDWL